MKGRFSAGKKEVRLSVYGLNLSEQPGKFVSRKAVGVARFWRGGVETMGASQVAGLGRHRENPELSQTLSSAFPTYNNLLLGFPKRRAQINRSLLGAQGEDVGFRVSGPLIFRYL